MKDLTIDGLIKSAWILIALLVSASGGAFIGGALRDHFDHIKVVEGQLEHTLETLGDANEERYLYRKLAISIFKECNNADRREAEGIVDEWVAENRDSVNIKTGYLTKIR